jgi:hypothetical protein
MGRVTAVAVLIVLTLAATADARAATGDSASGIVGGARQCGTTTCLRIDDAFAVHAGPAGENATGTVRQYLEADIDPGPHLGVQGPATCLNVVGNRAAIGFVANVVPGGNIPTTPYAVLVVEDNGPGGTDQVRTFPASQPVTACPDPRTFTLAPITAGNLTVHDAMTHAQAKAACVAERQAIGRAAFRAKYGTPGHAMRACVRQHTG